jgi:hypothetical protein
MAMTMAMAMAMARRGDDEPQRQSLSGHTRSITRAAWLDTDPLK